MTVVVVVTKTIRAQLSFDNACSFRFTARMVQTSRRERSQHPRKQRGRPPPNLLRHPQAQRAQRSAEVGAHREDSIYGAAAARTIELKEKGIRARGVEGLAYSRQDPRDEELFERGAERHGRCSGAP